MSENRAQHVDTWYAASSSEAPDEPRLLGDEQADVCVLGAGITGLSTALSLAEVGYRVIVLEAHRVGWGASGRSGGQMIFGFGCEQDKIESLVGLDDARTIWQAGLHGMRLLRQRIDRHQIDCDLRGGHAHVALKPRQMRELEAWKQALEGSYGYAGLQLWDQARVRQEIGSDRYIGGLFDPASGHIHPLNYTLGLARAAREMGVRIFENSAVIDVDRGASLRVRTAEGAVRAGYLCLAGNAYLNRIDAGLESRVMPVGTYIGASEPLGKARCRELITNDIAVADINFVLDYYRCSSDYRMLFGGRVSYSTRQPSNLRSSMYSRMVTVFPQLDGVRIDYAWGGFVAITMNRAPHFGRLDNNILFAHGFSGHGIAATGLAGQLMADAIRGQAECFDVFARIPHAAFPGGRWMRTPALVLAMMWYRMRDWLP